MKYFVEIAGRKIEVELPDDGSSGAAVIGGARAQFDYQPALPGRPASLILNNRSYSIDCRREDDATLLQVNGRDFSAVVEDERRAAMRRLLGSSSQKKKSAGEIKAPMPGLIVKVEVSEGETVKKGSGLVVIEAMKMENELRAPFDAVVATISAVKGTAVEKGALLLTLKPV